MSVTKPKLSLEKVLHLLRKPDARLVRLHSNNGGAGFYVWPRGGRVSMKSRNCCWGAMTYSPTTAACFPATRRAGAWATGVTGPNVCEGGPVSDERPFDDLPRGHFGAILADPPWKFRHAIQSAVTAAPLTRHYTVMTFDEIETLPVRELAAPDAWLFLWATGPCLFAADSDLIARWGFSYSGMASSGSNRIQRGIGLAHGHRLLRPAPKREYLSARAARQAARLQGQDVHRAHHPAAARSTRRKPDEHTRAIERLVAGPYLELFARQRRPGWTAWGDELDKFEPEYDAQDDFAKSLEEGYRVIRERVAAGGRKWLPK